MGCRITFTQLEIEVPLDCACFVPSVGNRDAYIAAVRGGTIYKMDPATGAKISSSPWSPNALSQSAITYDTHFDTILCAAINDPSITITGIPGFQQPHQKRFIFYVNPANFAVTTSVDLGTISGWSDPTFIAPMMGVWMLKYDAVSQKTAMAINVGGRTDVAWFDAANTPDFVDWGTLANGTIWSDIDIDHFGGRSVVWAIDSQEGFAWGVDMTNTSKSVVTNYQTNKTVYSVSTSGNGIVYVTEGVRFIQKWDATIAPNNPRSHATLLATLDTGDPSFIGLHARFNSHNGLIYIAGYSSNKVAILNPADDSIVIRTGFDLPYDVVFTPSKAFAVQQGAVGLLAIP